MLSFFYIVSYLIKWFSETARNFWFCSSYLRELQAFSYTIPDSVVHSSLSGHRKCSSESHLLQSLPTDATSVGQWISDRYKHAKCAGELHSSVPPAETFTAKTNSNISTDSIHPNCLHVLFVRRTSKTCSFFPRIPRGCFPNILKSLSHGLTIISFCFYSTLYSTFTVFVYLIIHT